MVSKEQIISLLATNDKAVARALVALNDRQTADEQQNQSTRLDNGMGFKPCHARMGTSMAEFFQKNGYLSPKQIAYWRKVDANGSMRIGCYWKQLMEVAAAKEATKAQVLPKFLVPGGFRTKLMNEKVELEETLAAYNEGAFGDVSDEAYDRIFGRMEQISEALEELDRCEYKMRRDGMMV
jgi:hypothetical protein